MLKISCKKAAELICESLDRPLGPLESLRLRLHVWMCGDCHAFMEQNTALLRLFEERFRRLPEGDLAKQIDGLPLEICERLKQKLREATQTNTPPEE